MPEPTPTSPDDVLLQMVRVGVCGTDRHVMARAFDRARQLPEGSDVLVLGHEAVGRVAEVGTGVTGLQVGDVVVPTVRRPCGRCTECNAGQADMCSTGLYRERGIVGLHGFLSERVVDRQENLVRVPAEMIEVAPLVESLCTPEKALRRIGNARAHLPRPDIHRALVTGSGPIALLAVLALRLRGVETCALARQPADGLAAELVASSGATYVLLQEVDPERPRGRLGEFDAVVEATGAIEMAVLGLGALARNGVLDLAGGGGGTSVPLAPSLLGSMVGRNLTMLGSVNANADDWRCAVADLTATRQQFPGVIERVITHTFRMTETDVAFERTPGQIKAIIEVSPV
jgi:threonine dehydrogenase-like Zn-dependent dehydrogenase